MTDAILSAAQQTRALTALESWVQRKPGRALAIEIIDGRFRLTLADTLMVGRNTLPDVLAQAAQLAILEEEPGT